MAFLSRSLICIPGESPRDDLCHAAVRINLKPEVCQIDASGLISCGCTLLRVVNAFWSKKYCIENYFDVSLDASYALHVEEIRIFVSHFQIFQSIASISLDSYLLNTIRCQYKLYFTLFYLRLYNFILHIFLKNLESTLADSILCRVR